MLHRNFLRRLLCTAAIAAPLIAQARVRTGIEVLRDRGFAGLQGKRVGLVTNPSGVDGSLRTTIDILAANVNLVALYAPEHGVRGDIWAGEKVASDTDKATGLPVHSLYGATREPTREMLFGIDIMVYDIQDVGSRSYTFISTLGLVMRKCAECGIPVMVLDRPNPLGGRKIEGAPVQDGFHSFVGQYSIPYIYGLTVGELACLLNEERLNRGQRGDAIPMKCDLTVIKMEGWSRDMLYEDTGLPWVMPSPNIPYPRNAVCYPCSGLVGEFNGFLNIGIGYSVPFDAFAAEWIDADELRERLESYRIPGVVWRSVHYTPFFGSSARKLLHGVQWFFTDYEAAPLTLLQFYVLQAVHELYGKDPFADCLQRTAMFDKVCGSDYIRKTFSQRYRVADILDYWTRDTERFRLLAEKYYLYR